MTRLAQCLALLVPIARTLPWPALAAAALVAVAVTLLPEAAPMEARVAGVSIAVAASYAVADDAAALASATQLPQVLRRSLRVALVVPFAFAAWWVAARLADPGAAWAVREFGALLAVAFAAAAVRTAAAGPVLAGVMIVTMIGDRSGQLAAGGSAAGRLWWLLAAGAAAVFLVVSLGPDRPRPRRPERAGARG